MISVTLRTFEFNAEKRKHQDNDFVKGFFKLMNNVVFGEIMENLRKKVILNWSTIQNKALQVSRCYILRLLSYIFWRPAGSRKYAEEKAEPESPNLRWIYHFGSLYGTRVCVYQFHYEYIKQTYIVPTQNSVLTHLLRSKDRRYL